MCGVPDTGVFPDSPGGRAIAVMVRHQAVPVCVDVHRSGDEVGAVADPPKVCVALLFRTHHTYGPSSRGPGGPNPQPLTSAQVLDKARWFLTIRNKRSNRLGAAQGCRLDPQRP